MNPLDRKNPPETNEEMDLRELSEQIQQDIVVYFDEEKTVHRTNKFVLPNALCDLVSKRFREFRNGE